MTARRIVNPVEAAKLEAVVDHIKTLGITAQVNYTNIGMRLHFRASYVTVDLPAFTSVNEFDDWAKEFAGKVAPHERC